MGAAFYVVLERELEGRERGIDGKALCRHAERLDSVAAARDAPSPYDFLSADPAEVLADLHEQGALPASVTEVPAVWFEPAPGLRAARVWREGVEAAGDFEGKDLLLADLRALEGVLAAADAAGVRWYLAVDA